MIRPTDAIVVATTKLRNRKLRTIITIFIPSLLFGLLIAAIIAAQGASNSIGDFSSEGFSSRFLVSASQGIVDPSHTLRDKGVIERAEVIYKNTIANKEEAARRLGVAYDKTTEITPTTSFDGTKENVFLNLQSPYAQQAIAEKHTGKTLTLSDLKKVASPYSPKAYYVSEIKQPTSGKLVYMDDGKESFIPAATTSSTIDDSIFGYSPGFILTDPAITAPFMLKNSQPGPSQVDAIPLVLPYGKVAQLLGLKPLGSNALPEQKIEREKEIRAKAHEVTFSACYRNSASQAQITSAIQAAAEINKNVGSKTYQQPNLVYALPDASSCGSAVVVRDVRTTAEKDLEEKQKNFDEEFGQAVNPPEQQKITFRVVGLVADITNPAPTNTALGLFQSFVGSSLSGAIASPSNLYDKLPSSDKYSKIFARLNDPVHNIPASSYFVEFSKADEARRFIASEACPVYDDDTCQSSGKPFQLNAFGSNSIALEDVAAKVTNVLLLATFVVFVIAALIMSNIVGRMISDSRRETAVFRAIGFKRLDIASIYMTYAFLLAIGIAIFSLFLGIAIAYGLDTYFSHQITIQAQLAFGVSDFSKEFHFFAFNPRIIGGILALVILSGLAGTIFPLARNLRRNPIDDMRDE